MEAESKWREAPLPQSVQARPHSGINLANPWPPEQECMAGAVNHPNVGLLVA